MGIMVGGMGMGVFRDCEGGCVGVMIMIRDDEEMSICMMGLAWSFLVFDRMYGVAFRVLILV